MVSNASYAAYGGGPRPGRPGARAAPAWPRVRRRDDHRRPRGARADAACVAEPRRRSGPRAAGVDLLLFVGSERSTEQVYAALLAEARAGRLPRAALERSAAASTSSPRPTRARFRRRGRRARRLARARRSTREAPCGSRAGGRRLGSRSGSSSSSARPARERRSPARALGSLPGFVDLDEVQPWKAAIPGLMGQPDDEVAARLRQILERVRTARPGPRPARRRADSGDELRARGGARRVPRGGRRPRGA